MKLIREKSRRPWLALLLAAAPVVTATPSPPQTLLGPSPPFVPRKTDAGVEFGLMHFDEDNFAIGANYGVNVGRCVFSDSDTCQQYVDGIVNANVREAESYGLFLASMRWQFVNLPKRYSPFARVFAGAADVNRAAWRGWNGAIGGGIGVTTYLHEKIDLRLELRAGYVDQPFSGVMLGVQVKIDDLLLVFAKQLRDLGIGTIDTAVDVGGAAVHATKEGVSGVVSGVSSPFESGKKPTPSPTPAAK